MSNWVANLFTKSNPAQQDIAVSESGSGYSSTSIKAYDANNNIGIVNRCVTLIADSAAEVPIKVFKLDKATEKLKEDKSTRLSRFLVRPNNQYDRHRFTVNIITDLVIDGNAFIYIDKDGLFHLPAKFVFIQEDKIDFVKGYKYIANGSSKLINPDNIIHMRLSNNKSVYRGVGKLEPILDELNVYKEMLIYQKGFFNNSAMPKLVLESDNTIGQTAKSRMLEQWKRLNSTLNKKAGGTAILDGGLKAKVLDNSFRDMDFNEGLIRIEKHIALALGVPWVLLNSGNNANIRNNQRLFYQQTVLPLVKRVAMAIEFHVHKINPKSITSIRVQADEFSVTALRPDLKEHADYLSTLINGGVLTPNEGRYALRKQAIDGLDEIRVPVNVAGSAADPSQGGKPSASTSN